MHVLVLSGEFLKCNTGKSLYEQNLVWSLSDSSTWITYKVFFTLS